MNPYRTPPPPDADEPTEPIKPKWQNPYAPDLSVRPRPWNGTAPENRFDDGIGWPRRLLLRWLEAMERV